MPDRYHIHTAPTPGQFRRVGKYGNVDWREDCSRCSNCVKLRCCFDAYKKENAYNYDAKAPVEPLNDCKACLSCVQGCTKGLLSLSINPEFLDMGNEYWTPDIIINTWNQADAGRIPVSGAGYRGPFCGPGFDSIWTDMSEIVRPTRDGIHGREYISTAVDIGYKPLRLSFSPEGKLLDDETHLVETQLPLLLDVPTCGPTNQPLAMARAAAAKELKTLAVVRAENAGAIPVEHHLVVVPILNRADLDTCDWLIKQVSMVELEDGPELVEMVRIVRTLKPHVVVAVRMALGPNAADEVMARTKQGLRVFHLVADPNGREVGAASPRHIKDALREIHGRLVVEGLRDEVTLIISGGIALAEHMAKAIICGADLVGVDTPLRISLGCTVCGGMRNGRGPEAGQELVSLGRCSVGIRPHQVTYAAQRMINLMGAWHSQLIEVLGAMGIREVRRLRGETGRAIFMEDMEREAFGDLIRT
ncbi:MAG: hypothetical protein BWX88_03523 [Planctomycetes bacterium ADurb.Bin126]|nr:MAG: hypothetical protein BWX88_03523 [Planctomycetes bacterium ADurb.Bin126]HOD83527.1 glutamate synthase-related protein [Phycisphaerae bacterium]HQL75099.1 glutamate synthase-related protein [Phycisphaerae bacterium]